MKWFLVILALVHAVAADDAATVKLSAFVPSESRNTFSGRVTNSSRKPIYILAPGSLRAEYKENGEWKKVPRLHADLLQDWITIEPGSDSGLLMRVHPDLYPEDSLLRAVLYLLDPHTAEVIETISSPEFNPRQTGANKAE